MFFFVCVRLTSLNMESESLEEEESHLIINAVKDANIPKFVTEDLPLFTRILADLFPGMDPPAPDDKLLKVKTVWCVKEMMVGDSKILEPLRETLKVPVVCS